MIQLEGYTPILNYLIKVIIDKRVGPAGQLIVMTMHMDADARTAMYFGDPLTIARSTGLKAQTVRNELQSLRKKGLVIYESSNRQRYKNYFLPLCKLQTNKKKIKKSTVIIPTWDEILFRAKFEFEEIEGKSTRKQVTEVLFSESSWLTRYFSLFTRELKNTELNAAVIESFDVPESARRNIHKRQVKKQTEKSSTAKKHIKKIRAGLK